MELFVNEKIKNYYTSNINKIKRSISLTKNIFTKLLNILPEFKITDESILPYGLKAHTRSVSWLVEQVIVQQTKFNKNKLLLDEVEFDFPDTALHDCKIIKNKRPIYINIKIHNTNNRHTKNDISAVERLFFQYSSNKNYELVYACFGIKFDNLKISFDKKYLTVFSPQFLPIYVNPRNDKIQAYYDHKPVYREREEFLNQLKLNSKSIKL